MRIRKDVGILARSDLLLTVFLLLLEHLHQHGQSSHHRSSSPLRDLLPVCKLQDRHLMDGNLAMIFKSTGLMTPRRNRGLEFDCFTREA